MNWKLNVQMVVEIYFFISLDKKYYYFEQMEKNYVEKELKPRKTKIICTMGPSSENEDTVKKMILAGMNVARFNMSHGDYADQARGKS